MSACRCALKGLCLACTIAVALCVQSCRERQSARSHNPENRGVSEPPGAEPADHKISEPSVKRARYANDLDRLDQLTDRMNRACRGSHTVVFGGEGSLAGGGLVSIDYALFDKLSDDGAAVLIAEAIATKSELASSLQEQTQANIERALLEADELVGTCVARAGFSSAGFTEWLKARRISTTGPEWNRVPDNMRVAVFMRGYGSERMVRKGK